MASISPPWRLAVPPRAWQTEALAAWDAAGGRGIVGVVTGAGKTIFAELCMLSFLSRFPGGRINIVVPTLALLDQWYVSLREDLGVTADEIATFSGEGRAERPASVNLAVLNTARDLIPDIAASGDVLLIVDECHHAASPMNARALRGPNRATLGMSATPERDYDEGLEDVLVPALGGVIYRYDYNRAVRDRVISPFELVNVAVDLLPTERAEYDRLSRRVAAALSRLRGGQPVEDMLKRVLQRRAAVASAAALRVPVTLRLAELHRGARMLVFHERIDAAEGLRGLLQQRNFSATIYHSRMNPIVRRDNLRLFRRGVFDTLVSCRALDEGINVPETTVAIIASSTASVRQRIQRLGRVLRPAPGKDQATVYTLYATEVEERRLRKEESSLTEAQAISWKRSTLPGHG